MHIQEIRTLVQREEIDYVTLMSMLAQYANPRMKISHVLRSGDLIRVKKGLYVFGDRVRRQPYSVETLANLIYGPSAISLEYALSYHGMIPERVTTITSITPSRNKLFRTPVGIFSYTHLHHDKFGEGIERIVLDPQHPVLMAGKEKALADLLTLSKASPVFDDAVSLRAYLRGSLRIGDSSLSSLNTARLKRIDAVYRHKNTGLLIVAVDAVRRNRHA